MKKTISIISIYIGVLVLLIAFGFSPLYADISQNSQKLIISDGKTTIQSFNDIIFNGALHTTDGTNIAKTQDNESTIIYTATSGNIVSLGVLENYIIFTKENDFVFLYDTTANDNQALTLAHYLNFENIETAITPETNKNIACSANNELFIIMGSIITKLDKTTNKLILLKNIVVNEETKTYTNGGFCVNENGTKLYFSINADIFCYDLENDTITQIESELSLSHEITEIAVDVLENIYCLSNNTLYKLPNTTDTFDFDIEVNNLSIDFTSGTIYASTSDECYKITDTTNLVTNYSTLASPVDIQNYTATESVVEVIKINSDAKLYSYKSLYTQIYNYNAEKSLILLDSSDNEFYFVLDTSFNDTYQTGYVLKSDCSLPLTQNAPTIEQLKVIVSSAKLYTLPNSIMFDESTYAPILCRVNHGTILSPVASPELPIDSNGTEFIAVKVQNGDSDVICYIDSRTVIDATNDNALPNVIVSNASTRATTKIYLDSALNNEIDTLDKNFSVTILENENGVCKIQYISNGEVKTGYCNSSFINDGTLNFTQILGIILMCVSLVLAVIISICIVISNKKKRKPLI